ncbi:MAG: IPT/TIG domain-containing protein [bacterium]
MKNVWIERAVIAGLFIFSACKNNSPTEPNTPPTSGTISTGSTVAVMSGTIASNGGELRVSTGSLAGLVLSVPSNAYSGTKSFEISYADITGSQLRTSLSTIGPMIKIRNGGGYADSLMKLRIPVKVQAGKFAMGFFYVDRTGELEPLPLFESDSNHILIGTRHFSPGLISNVGSARAGTASPQSADDIANIVIIAMDFDKLVALKNVESNFIPGRDDWEFINYGSQIAPGGHCAGQSMTAMWYFYEEKPKVNIPLWGRFDTVANFQYDDNRGYRFASTIQKDFNFDGWIKNIDFQKTNSPLTYWCFALGIYASKQPQSLLMTSNSGGGHAMIVYGVDLTDRQNGRLVIADPNKPGKESEIKLTAGTFAPYVAGLKADGAMLQFENIGFAGKSSYLAWDKIRPRYQEVLNNTIGNDRFPAYKYYILNSDGSRQDLTEYFATADDSLDIYPDCPTLNTAVFSGHDRNGNTVSVNPKLALKGGENIVGFYLKQPYQIDATHKGERYIDFHWYHIFALQPTITKLVPNTAAIGDVIEIDGVQFGNDQAKGKVTFIDVVAKQIVSWSDTKITVKVPQGARTGNVYVSVGSRRSNGMVLNMGEGITSILPADSCGVGNLMTIYGDGFGNSKGLSSKVFLQNMKYGGSYPDIISWSNTMITCTVPVNIMPGDILRSDSINVIVIVNNTNLPPFVYKVFNPIPPYVYKATGLRLNFNYINPGNVSFSGTAIDKTTGFPNPGFDFDGLQWDKLNFTLSNSSKSQGQDGWTYEYNATCSGEIDSVYRFVNATVNGGGRIYRNDTTYMQFTYSMLLDHLQWSSTNGFGNTNTNNPIPKFTSIVHNVSFSGDYMNFNYNGAPPKTTGSWTLIPGQPSNADVQLLFH